MKFITSYGVALVLLLLVGGWLVTGTLIQGGSGEGNGERSIISMFSSNEKAKDNGEPALAAQAEKNVGETSIASDGDKDTAGVSGAGATNGDKDKEQAKLQSVRTVLFIAREMPIEVNLRGRTKASATISVNAETNGQVEQVHIVKGQTVNIGDLMCTLDSGTRMAKVAQAKAAVVQAEASLSQVQADFETNKALREKGLSAPNTARSFEVQLQAAKASLAAAISNLKTVELELEKTRIHAKVSGIVQDPLANVGDMMNVGSICATIVQLDPMLFIGKVAESKVMLLRKGISASVQSINGQSVNGTLSYVASIADNATRSFDVEIEIPNPNGIIRSGLTANASIIVGKTRVHIIPQSSLTLDSNGAIGVKIVDEDNKVHFLEVEIIRDSNDGVWVIGLPEKSQVIIFGQEYVIDNQIVDATLVSGKSSS